MSNTPEAVAAGTSHSHAHAHPHAHTPASSWSDARTLAHALGVAHPTVTARLPLAQAHGRVLAEPLRSQTALPPRAASAMDGWAVAGEPPWLLGAPIDAGMAPEPTAMVPGTARPIATGAPVPVGAHGILRLENGVEFTRDGGRLLERGPSARPDEPRADEHVRPAGEEASAGELLLARGTLLTPPRIGLAAASGHDSLVVTEAPTIDLLVLGDELIHHGPAAGGSIRDVLTPSLPAILRAMGGGAITTHRAPDDRQATIDAIRSCVADVLIVTGGSSRGRTDHARAAAQSLAVNLDIDGVAMRPGHPVGAGARPDGRPVLLLPGNPFAAIVGLLSFGAPLLDGMTGRAIAPLPRVRLAEPVDVGHGDTRVVAVSIGDDGARPLALQGSGMLRGLAAADGLAVVQPGNGAVGATVSLLPLPW